MAMHPFHSLFTEEPETEYVPDFMGRLGQGGTVVKPDPEPIGTPSPRFDEFIKAERQGAGLTDLFGTDDPLSIKGPVGPFGPNRRADVGKVETFLSRTGNFDLTPTDGPTGYYGMRLEDSINAFQKNNKLKADGLTKPFGKTIRTLANKLKDQVEPPTRLVQQPKPAAALTPPGQGAGAGQETVPVKFNPGGGLPRTAVPETPGFAGGPLPAGAPPKKDPLEDFRKADRESMRRLEASRKSELTHRQAERTGERRLTRKIEEETRAFLERAKAANTASKRMELRRAVVPGGHFVPRIKIDKFVTAFERYLDGTGGVINYDPKWMLSHPKLRAAAIRNEDSFAKWMIGKGGSEDEQRRISRVLLALKNGQTRTDGTPCDGDYGFNRVKDKFSDHRLLLGNGFIRANGKFTFTRKGNSIEVTGLIEQKVSDPFDIESGKKLAFRMPGIEEKVDFGDMVWLAKHGKAKPFEVRSIWRRKISWQLRIVRDPNTGAKRIVGVGKPQWSDAK